MTGEYRGAVVVLDDGGVEADDLLARADRISPNVYRVTEDHLDDPEHHVLAVGKKHCNVKSVIATMYDERAYTALVPAALDPTRLLADYLSAARPFLADGFPGFVLINGHQGPRYRRIALVADARETITTGTLAMAGVGLAWRTGATLDVLLLGGDPLNPPQSFEEARADVFTISDDAEILEMALERAREIGLEVNWISLGEAAARDQLVLDAVREGGYDLVIDDLRPIDVGPRFGRLKRVRRQLIQGDSIDTAYRLLRDAPCDVGIVVDAVNMRLIPPQYAKAAAVAALSLGLLGVAARPAAATASASSASATTVEAPLDPAAEAEAEQDSTESAAAAADAEAAPEAQVAAPAPIGQAAPSADAIPDKVSTEQMAAANQAAAAEQAALDAAQAELTAMQQQQAAADAAVETASTDLSLAKQDVQDANATLDSAEDQLDYAESSRNTLTEEEEAQARGSFNKAKYNLDNAEQEVAQAQTALQQVSDAATEAAEATAEQQAVVDAQAANVNQWNAVVAEADSRTDQRIAPVAGYSITTAYGSAGSNWSSGYHTGSDYAAPAGTEVVAASGGTVTAAGFNGPYGNQITIQHDDGTQTTYSHLSELNVSVGQSVSVGDRIGAVGSTGNSTGPHLHFEAFDSSGNRMNPVDWLAGP